MKSIRLPDNINAKMTQKLLDWAATLPKFQGGYIFDLQTEHKNQQIQSQETYERTRPPEGTKLEFLGLRMIEIFYYEDFAKVKAGLLNLFPGLDDANSIESFEPYFHQFSESISWGGWKNLGFIYRNDNRPMTAMPCYQMADLPTEVDMITVGLYKSMPSMLTISFDIKLSNSATIKLRKLQEEMYLGKIYSIIDLKHRFLGMRVHSTDNAMRQGILKWQGDIRISVEECIKRFVCGYFANNSIGITKLPAIEIYNLEGSIEKFNDFASWANAASDWWRSLGFSFYSNLYSNGEILFNWGGIGSIGKIGEILPAHRVVVLWEAYKKAHDKEFIKIGPGLIISLIPNEILHTIITPFVAYEYLQSLIAHTEKLRRIIFSELKPSKALNHSIDYKIQLYGKVQEEKTILERMAFEFEHQKQDLRKEMAETEKLLEIKILSNKNNSDNNFGKRMFSEIEYFQKLVGDHIDFIDKVFSTHIEFENIRAIYRLQVITLGLTIIALITSLIGLTANWGAVSCFFAHSIDVIKNLMVLSK